MISLLDIGHFHFPSLHACSSRTYMPGQILRGHCVTIALPAFCLTVLLIHLRYVHLSCHAGLQMNKIPSHLVIVTCVGMWNVLRLCFTPPYQKCFSLDEIVHQPFSPSARQHHSFLYDQPNTSLLCVPVTAQSPLFFPHVLSQSFAVTFLNGEHNTKQIQYNDAFPTVSEAVLISSNQFNQVVYIIYTLLVSSYSVALLPSHFSLPLSRSVWDCYHYVEIHDQPSWNWIIA